MSSLDRCNTLYRVIDCEENRQKRFVKYMIGALLKEPMQGVITKRFSVPSNAIVIASSWFPKAGAFAPMRVILCMLPENNYTPYVTWLQNLQDGGCYHGNYHSNFEDAVTNFYERKERNVNRIKSLEEAKNKK